MTRPASATTGKGRIVCFGELLLRLSAPDRELPFQSPRLDARFGGAEANVAASLAILGHHAHVVSTLPANALGEACAGELRRHGVDTSAIHFAAGRMGLYFLAPGVMHRPSTVIYDRADSAFARSPAAHDWPGLLAGADWLHLSGINLAVGDATAQAALTAVRAARAAGVAVSFDCNHREQLWGARVAQAPALLRDMLAEADLVFGNERDIALILDAQFPQEDSGERFNRASQLAFARFPHLRWMASIARQHHHAEAQDLCGRLATRDALFTTPVHRLTNILDRIGSGDAFAAGLLHGLLRAGGEQHTLDFAVAAACLKHSLPGDVNLLGEAAMQSFLRQDGFDVKR